MRDEHLEGAHLKQREPMKAGKRKSKPSSWAGKGGSRSAAQVHMGDPSLTLPTALAPKITEARYHSSGRGLNSFQSGTSSQRIFLDCPRSKNYRYTDIADEREEKDKHTSTDWPKGTGHTGDWSHPRLSIWQTQLHICFLKNWLVTPLTGGWSGVTHQSLVLWRCAIKASIAKTARPQTDSRTPRNFLDISLLVVTSDIPK